MVVIQLERQIDESKLDHHKRLVYGKLVDKTLADIDYSELAEYVYGRSYASDEARKRLYGSKYTLSLLEDIELSAISDKDVLTKIDLKMADLRKEQQRFFDQRREYNKLLMNDGRLEHLYDSLISSADNLHNTVGRIFDDSDKRLYLYETDDTNEAVLFLSDWHYGMVTNNVFNKYNTDICKRRVERLIGMAQKRIVANQCNKLHVVVLGDLLHGGIHVSARVASEELVCDQLMQVSEILAQAIFELHKYVNETVVHITYGNHARTIQNKKESTHRDNIERLIPWWLEQRIKSEELALGEPLLITVEQESDNEFLFINACGHDICASHGDLDSVQKSPRLLTTLFQKKYGKDIECIILGDKHHRESFDELGVTAMICGSLCGTDDHANNKRLFSTPSQLLLIVNKEFGIDAEYRLKL